MCKKNKKKQGNKVKKEQGEGRTPRVSTHIPRLCIHAHTKYLHTPDIYTHTLRAIGRRAPGAVQQSVRVCLCVQAQFSRHVRRDRERRGPDPNA